MSDEYICPNKECYHGKPHEINEKCFETTRICPKCEIVKQKKQTIARKIKWGSECPLEKYTRYPIGKHVCMNVPRSKIPCGFYLAHNDKEKFTLCTFDERWRRNENEYKSSTNKRGLLSPS